MDEIRPSAKLLDDLRGAGSLLVLTGAGISAESGLATFRGPGGLWEGRDPFDLATPEAFRRDPETVWRFYSWRRRQAAQARPNAAHIALAELERQRAVTVVTQNVDGLHERAGTHAVLRLHGSLWRLRCIAEASEIDDAREELGELPPRCGCGALLRPAVVWFGEELPRATLLDAESAARTASVVLVIGSSSLVHPAAALPRIAMASGAWVVEINPEETPLSGLVHERLPGPAGRVLPSLLQRAGFATASTTDRPPRR